MKFEWKKDQRAKQLKCGRYKLKEKKRWREGLGKGVPGRVK